MPARFSSMQRFYVEAVVSGGSTPDPGARGLSRVGGSEPSRMGGKQVGLDLTARIGAIGEKMDMYLVRPAFRALMAEMSEIEARSLVLRLAEGQGSPGAVVVTANENIVGPRQSRAADEAVNAVEITPSRRTAPIVESLGEGGFGADQRRLVRKLPLRRSNFDFARPHRIPTR